MDIRFGVRVQGAKELVAAFRHAVYAAEFIRERLYYFSPTIYEMVDLKNGAVIGTWSGDDWVSLRDIDLPFNDLSA